jgi:hypothetical protein
MPAYSHQEAMDIKVTAKVVGPAPGHYKFGRMPGLAGLILELAQFKSAPGIFLAFNAGSHPMLTMAQTQVPRLAHSGG